MERRPKDTASFATGLQAMSTEDAFILRESFVCESTIPDVAITDNLAGYSKRMMMSHEQAKDSCNDLSASRHFAAVCFGRIARR